MYLITHTVTLSFYTVWREDDTSVILTITFSTSCLTFDSVQHFVSKDRTIDMFTDQSTQEEVRY